MTQGTHELHERHDFVFYAKHMTLDKKTKNEANNTATKFNENTPCAKMQKKPMTRHLT